jgi:hypothetical protein
MPTGILGRKEIRNLSREGAALLGIPVAWARTLQWLSATKAELEAESRIQCANVPGAPAEKVYPGCHDGSGLVQMISLDYYYLSLLISHIGQGRR